MNLSFKLYGTRVREQTIKKLANNLSLYPKDIFYDEQAAGKFPFELMRTVWTTDRNNSETHRVILQDDNMNSRKNRLMFIETSLDSFIFKD